MRQPLLACSVVVNRTAVIVDNIDRAEQFTKSLDAKTFGKNDQIIFAVKYALVIISEATAKLGDTAADLRPDIPWGEILAAQQRLSLYDAAYLELSRRCELPLATFNGGLRRAATAIGVTLLYPRPAPGHGAQVFPPHPTAKP